MPTTDRSGNISNENDRYTLPVIAEVTDGGYIHATQHGMRDIKHIYYNWIGG